MVLVLVLVLVVVVVVAMSGDAESGEYEVGWVVETRDVRGGNREEGTGTVAEGGSKDRRGRGRGRGRG